MLTVTKQFSFETNNNISVKYLIINNKTFIVYTLYNRLYYFVVPAFLNIISLKGLGFHIWAKLKTKVELNQYYSFFNAFFIFNDTNKKYKKKLFLKGLGFKIFYDKTLHLLNFKLGFSHLVLFSLPSNVFVSLNKTTLLLESKNNVVLGDIANKIKLLKIPDVYKGKGFVIKNEFIRSKPIKKK